MKSAFIIGPVLWALAFPVSAGELLGHISEDTTQPIPDTPPSPTNDRRIIYRVICSPGDEALPDCEKPLADNETVQTPKAIEAELNPPETVQDQEDIQEAKPATKSAKAKTGKRKTQSAKKSKTNKKSGSKKVSTKKATGKKKKH